MELSYDQQRTHSLARHGDRHFSLANHSLFVFCQRNVRKCRATSYEFRAQMGRVYATSGMPFLFRAKQLFEFEP